MAPLCKENVFSSIFNDYSETLFNYLYYKCGKADQAQDLVQEAFLKLWQKCAEVKLETAKGFVFKVANNKLLNAVAHEKVKLKFINQDHKSINQQDPSFLLEEKEHLNAINNAISNLPEKQRVAFLLSRIDKKTYKEIAEILGISRQAVEKRIYSALDTLRKVNKYIK